VAVGLTKSKLCHVVTVFLLTVLPRVGMTWKWLPYKYGD